MQNKVINLENQLAQEAIDKIFIQFAKLNLKFLHGEVEITSFSEFKRYSDVVNYDPRLNLKLVISYMFQICFENNYQNSKMDINFLLYHLNSEMQRNELYEFLQKQLAQSFSKTN